MYYKMYLFNNFGNGKSTDLSNGIWVCVKIVPTYNIFNFFFLRNDYHTTIRG